MNARIALVMIALLVGLTAEAAEPRWTLRFHGALVQSSGSGESTTTGGATFRIDSGTSGGLGFGAEYRLSRRVGLEVSTLLATFDVGTRVSAGGSSLTESTELSMMPWMLSVPFHFRAGSRSSVFVAPSVGYVTYHDTRMSLGAGQGTTTVEVGSDTAIGAAIGLDAGFGKRDNWAFSTGFHFMKASANGTDVDPMIVTVGFAYRF